MALSHADLEQFTGTRNWYRHFTGGFYTDGAKYLADNAGAWQTMESVSGEPFQVWCLTVNEDRSALLTCDDGDGKEVASQAIPFTDFPLPEISLYFTDKTVLLPSEY